jgi:hypothetical protein
MSMTEDEYAYDQYMSDLYAERKKEAVEEFTAERLRSYYGDNKLLAKPALEALATAKTLVGVNASAGFVFAAVATEVGLKETLLKPIVSGMVHTSSVASLITNLVVSHQSMDRYRELLIQTLREHGGVDLDTYKRAGSTKPIWEEIREVQNRRNLIVHRAELASTDHTALALGVAATIVEDLFPKVVQKMGLHIHEGFRICDDWKCAREEILAGPIVQAVRIALKKS